MARKKDISSLFSFREKKPVGDIPPLREQEGASVIFMIVTNNSATGRYFVGYCRTEEQATKHANRIADALAAQGYDKRSYIRYEDYLNHEEQRAVISMRCTTDIVADIDIIIYEQRGTFELAAEMTALVLKIPYEEALRISLDAEPEMLPEI